MCTFSHRPPASYFAIAMSSIGIAVVGFGTWGHHMFVAGISEFDSNVFGALSMFVAIFSAIKVSTWVATMRHGAVQFNTPMLYFFWFMFLFVFGGMTGVAVATQSLDVPWHDTYFVVAHFHFIMVGGTLTGFLAAAHYWFPKMSGECTRSASVSSPRSRSSRASCSRSFRSSFWAMPGMPRRYFSYPVRFQALHVLSTGGAFLLAGALFLTLLNLLVSLRYGARAPGNPWGSRSYEWLTPSMPPKTNFPEDETLIMRRGPYDYHVAEDVPNA